MSLQASELRIGNFANCFTGMMPSEIRQITIDDFQMNEDGGLTTSFEPIPLTPEWLEKFGFRRNQNAVDYVGFNDWIHPSEVRFQIGDYNELGYLLDAFDSMPPMRFVHQLQNLFYALTGTELTIKD